MVPGVTDSTSDSSNLRELRFPRRSPFFKALNQRVNDSFEGKSKAGGRAILRKTFIIGCWWLASYAFLLFAAQGTLSFLLGGLSMAMAIAGIGFSIQHDGGHASYSENPRLNRWAALSLDFIGGSSWVWKSKHNFLHHYYTNVDGVDADLQDGSYMRLSPLQPRKSVHRWQHLYAWLLYGLLPIKWHFLDDFLNLKQQRVGEQPIRLDDPGEIRVMLLGKLVFFSWSLLIPTLFHGIGPTLLVYLYVNLCLGVILAVVFQLAHCVDKAQFIPQPEPGEKLPMDWAEHQVRTTVDFAPKSRFWTWYLGGLNYQVEHHLFPKISHIHYPAMAPIVRATCAEFEIPYASYESVPQAVLAHYRFLRELGRS